MINYGARKHKQDIIQMINKASILLLGLDASGKTTILYKLKLGEVINTIPTLGFNVETINYKNNELTIWDIGGSEKVRQLWRHYIVDKQGLIFVIDAYDPERFEIAAENLNQILSDGALERVPIVIFFNKSDHSTQKLDAGQLGLTKYTNPYLIQQCCAKTGEGLIEGIEWLTQYMEIKEVVEQELIINDVEQQDALVAEQIPDKRLLMLGDTESGKTSILYRLKLNETITTIPTIGFNVESLEYNDYRLTLWDVGGNEKIRVLWKHYYENTKGLIFVIDASNQQSVQNGNVLLQGVINQEVLKGVPLLVFSNKQDLERCLSIPTILSIINLENSGRQWQIQECSAITGEGLQEGIDWLKKQL